MSTPIRVGIVGLGRAGLQAHAAELAARPEHFVVVAGFDPIAERGAQLNDRTGARACESLDDLLDDPRVELVDVANRSVDHFPVASRALEAGKLVLVEKPMCVSYADAKRLADLDAELGGGRLFVRHNRRFDPDFVHLREIVDSGVLGYVYEIVLRRHQYQRRNDWQTVRDFGGGQLLNWGPHIVDHALQLLGSAPARIWSDLKRVVASGDAEDHVRIVLQGQPREGTSTDVSSSSHAARTVDLEISGGVAITEPEYRVYGTRGTLVGSTREFRMRYLDPDVPLAPREVDLSPPEGYGARDDLQWIEETRPVAPHDTSTMWDGLYAEIRDGGHYPVTLEQALEVMRILDVACEHTPFG